MGVPPDRDSRTRASVAGLTLFALALVVSAFGSGVAPALDGPIEIPIATGSDDAEQLVSGWLGLTSSDIELVDEFAPQRVGLRFTGIPIPQGAVVRSAHIRFTVDEADTGIAADLTIAAHDTADPPTFGPDARIADRPLTAEFVTWSPPSWQTIGASGPDQTTPDLSPLIQHMVDRPDWTAGGAIAFVVTGSGTRVAESFEGGAPATLVVDWETSRPDASTTTTSTTTAPTSSTTTTVPTTSTTTTLVPTTTSTSTTTTTTTTAPPAGSGTIERRVVASNDDVEELPSGWLYTISSDLELVDDNTRQTVGIRFPDLGIPAEATIVRSWVQFTVDEVSLGPAAVEFRAVAIAEVAPFAGTAAVSNLPVTRARVPWDPPEWIAIGASGDAQRTPDLSVVLQEVVSGPEWSADSDLAIVATGAGTRTAAAYDGRSDAAPLLHVEWALGQPTPAVNTPPHVAATATPAAAGDSTSLQAHVTDDGLPLPPGGTTVLWSQVSGPASVTITDTAAESTWAVLPTPGEYVFRVVASDGEATAAAEATVIVPESAPEPVPSSGTTRLAVIGDYGGPPSRMQGLADLVESLAPDAIVTVGDNVYATSGYDRLVGRFFQPYIGAYSGAYGPGSPVNRFFPALGNHDYDDGGIGAYLSFFDLPGATVASSDTSGNERYYDVRVGNAHVFIVNSNPQEPDGLTPATVQGRWLQSALHASDAEWKLVVVHHPPYSSLQGKSAVWMRWPYADWGADLVLAGDAHAYERLHGDGIDIVVNGLGINNTTLDGPRVPESRAFWSQDTPGALLIQACDGALEVALHPVGHPVVDPFVIGSGGCS